MELGLEEAKGRVEIDVRKEVEVLMILGEGLRMAEKLVEI